MGADADKEGGRDAQVVAESETIVLDNNNDNQDNVVFINSSNLFELVDEDISEENQAPILTPSKGGSDSKSNQNLLDAELTDKDQVPPT